MEIPGIGGTTVPIFKVWVRNRPFDRLQGQRNVDLVTLTAQSNNCTKYQVMPDKIAASDLSVVAYAVYR